MTESTGNRPVPSAEDERETEHERARQRSFWRAVAYYTSLGWFIALPIAAGLLPDHTLDQYLGTGHAWTLALLGGGIGVAILEGYLAVRTALRKGARHD